MTKLEQFKKNIRIADSCVNANLLTDKNPCTYFITRSCDSNPVLREPKFGFCAGNTRMIYERIWEQISNEANFDELDICLEGIYPIEAWLEKQANGLIADKYCAKEILQNGFDIEPYSSSKSPSRKIEWHMPITHETLEKVKKAANEFFQNEGKFEKPVILTLKKSQKEALEKTLNAFDNGITKFILNAPCRWGKTSYAFSIMENYCNRKSNDEISVFLVYTFKNEIQDGWFHYANMLGYHIITTTNKTDIKTQYNEGIAKGCTKFVVFGSVADIYGTTEDGYVKKKNRMLHKIQFDIAFGDEYHYGIHNKKADKMFIQNDEDIIIDIETIGEFFTSEELPIHSNRYVYLTATGFVHFTSGKFCDGYDGHIVTYLDMKNDSEYDEIPTLHLLHMEMNEKLFNDFVETTKKNEFSFIELFATKMNNGEYEFVHKGYATRALSNIFNSETEFGGKSLYGGDLPQKFDESLKNCIVAMDRIGSCYAAANYLKTIPYFNHFFIHIVAGDDVIAEKEMEIIKQEQVGIELGKYRNKFGTIVFTCGKLLTGVSVPHWSSLILLTEKKKIEWIMQAVGRLMTPCKSQITNEVIKKDCFVFDPNINRILELRFGYDYFERLKIRGHKSSMEIYNSTSSLIDFSKLTKYGEIISVDYKDAIDIDLFNGGKTKDSRLDYIIKYTLVNPDINAVNSFFKKHSDKLNLERTMNIYNIEKTIINECPNVIKPKTGKICGKRSGDKIHDKFKKLINIGYYLPILSYVCDENPRTYEEFRKLDEETVKYWTGYDFKAFDDALLNDCCMSIDSFERVLELNCINKERMIEKLANMSVV